MILQQDTIADTIQSKIDTTNFLGTNVKSEFQQLQLIDHNIENWIFILIICLLAILSFGLFFHKKKFELVLQASIIQRHTNQLIRESNPLSERISLILLLIYLFSFSLFIYYGLLIFTNVEVILSGLLLYTVIFSVVFISWLLKTILIKISGILFNTQQQATQHIISNFLLNISTGLIYLIIDIPMIYSQPLIMIYVGVLLIIITFVLKVYRGFQIGLNFTKFSKFHLFLYLCTLEILPVIVIVKFCYIFLVGI